MTKTLPTQADTDPAVAAGQRKVKTGKCMNSRHNGGVPKRAYATPGYKRRNFIPMKSRKKVKSAVGHFYVRYARDGTRQTRAVNKSWRNEMKVARIARRPPNPNTLGGLLIRGLRKLVMQ